MKTVRRNLKLFVILLSALITMSVGAACVSAAGETASYTIKYETSDGTALMDDETQTAAIGSDIQITPVDINGFQAVAKSYSFTLEEDGQVFTVIYRRAGGTEIGSAYAVTEDGTEVETVPDEDVPMASGDITGYSLSSVENGEQVPLSSGNETEGLQSWHIILISVIGALAAAAVIISFIRYFRQVSELKDSFEIASHTSKKNKQ